MAPPPVETPLLQGVAAGEFQTETRGQRNMDPATLVQQTIAGIERGQLEIRPGLSNVLKTMSRVAPQFMFRQLTRVTWWLG
ncbi:hypothetical protein Q0M94_22645 (plasmid) [Deinococcus radiomollis]|uniref:hypothetical protein n=1 Tax=Deinococcus radiomollis TaxID=468916 RepID=UPI0038922047